MLRCISTPTDTQSVVGALQSLVYAEDAAARTESLRAVGMEQSARSFPSAACRNGRRFCGGWSTAAEGCELSPVPANREAATAG